MNQTNKVRLVGYGFAMHYAEHWKGLISFTLHLHFTESVILETEGRILIRSATVKTAVYSMFYENMNKNSKETAAWGSILNYQLQIDVVYTYI